MKIIVSSTRADIDSQVDTRFGRCTYYLAIDPDSLEWEAFPNPGANASGGAGIKASQFVISKKPDALVSGDFGPNAFEVLSNSSISLYTFDHPQTAREAAIAFREGKLKPFGAPTGSGKHGHGTR